MNEAVYSNLVDDFGYTPLLKACDDENYETVLELIEHGTDTNVADKFGHTPLAGAARYAYKDQVAAAKIVLLLLENKANINAQNMDGETALMLAAIYNYTEIVCILIEHGADVNLRRTDGDTVISTIESAPSSVRKRKRMIKMLEEAGGIR